MSIFETVSIIILVLTAGFTFWQARSSREQTKISREIYEDSKKFNEETQKLLHKEFSVSAQLHIGFTDDVDIFIFKLTNNSKRTITINNFLIETERGFYVLLPGRCRKYEIPKKLFESDELDLIIEKNKLDDLKTEKIKKIYFTDNNQKEYIIDKIYHQHLNNF
jgi:hypothetical protein